MIQKSVKIIAIVFLLGSCVIEKPLLEILYPKINESELLFKEAFEKAESEQTEYFSRSAILLEEAISEYDLNNGYIYYNMANAWFHAGNIGKAILNYRKAENRLPANNNIQNNLNFTRTKVIDNIEQGKIIPLLRTLFFLHYDITFKAKVIILIISLFSIFSCGTFLLYKKKKLLKNIIMILTILMGLFIFSIIIEASEKTAGVIIVPEIIARKGDSNGYESSFTSPLHEGVEFVLISKRTGWFQIEINDGRQCWVPEYSVKLID